MSTWTITLTLVLAGAAWLAVSVLTNHSQPKPQVTLLVTLPTQSGQRLNHFAPAVISIADSVVHARSADTLRNMMQQISLPVIRDNTHLQPAQASVQLYSTPSDYARAVRQAFPAAEFAAVMQQTGGFTVNATVIIPAYKYSDPGALVNTITHELTHVALNENGLGHVLPSWINEGFAWYNGLQAESRVNASEVTALSTSLLRQLGTARDAGQVLPVNATASTWTTHPIYNVQFVYYLAVQSLIEGYGIDKFRSFLAQTPARGVNRSFEIVYHMPLSTYVSTFDKSLA